METRTCTRRRFRTPLTHHYNLLRLGALLLLLQVATAATAATADPQQRQRAAQGNSQAPCVHKKGNVPGTCKHFFECEFARSGVELKELPQFCEGATQSEPVVCCADVEGFTPPPAPAPSVHLAVEKPKCPDKPEANPLLKERCSNLTKPVTRSLAEKKCWEYHEYLFKKMSVSLALDAHPCDDAEMVCFSSQPSALIIGGKRAAPKEFPHMAILASSFGDQKVQYCGGSLISEQWVLTAAHCIKEDKSAVSEPEWVILGELNLSEDNEEEEKRQEVKVKRRVVHPHYTHHPNHNDIALLELDRPVEMSEFVRPACLYTGTGSDILRETVVATGWGRTKWVSRDERGWSKDWSPKTSDDLMRVKLRVTTTEECKNSWRNVRKPQSLSPNTQLCAGGAADRTQADCLGPNNTWICPDTCQGDSGGPLQIHANEKDCMYRIAGVTSFGYKCGTAVPAVYTRVSAFVEWIESHVWPCEKADD